jgi:hypothetical protein
VPRKPLDAEVALEDIAYAAAMSALASVALVGASVTSKQTKRKL